jgi:hypothetical protein
MCGTNFSYDIWHNFGWNGASVRAELECHLNQLSDCYFGQQRGNRNCNTWCNSGCQWHGSRWTVNGQSILSAHVQRRGAVHIDALGVSGTAIPLYVENNTSYVYLAGANYVGVSPLLIVNGEIQMDGNKGPTADMQLTTSDPLSFDTWAWGNGNKTKSQILATQLDYTTGHARMDIRPGGTTSLSLLYSGNVGIGTTNPQAKLEINGNLRFTADGSVQTTAWTGVLCGGDYAESVDVAGSKTQYGPGDVMIADPNDPGKFLKSSEPYSTAVLGVYSTKPGALGRRQTTPQSSEEVPMAMIGIVPTKVSAENGPVHPGDLLVASSTPGYAMKGTDRSRLVGAVIGKALGRLDSGTGIIEVGVTLQ